ncbi:MAG TPA: TspO/MBR family protein [Rhizomicrobium sp.]|jgi:tryptophan-rich sensory protein|nr:TspO/MBR family protein [Rhizomicrobium sp.]
MTTTVENELKSSPHWGALVGFLTLTLAVGAIAGFATGSSIDGWYATLAKPSFNPPNWVFGPVWTTLYVLMAFAAWRAWRVVGWRGAALAMFLVQLALNFAWSFIFFTAHQLGLALIELAVMLVAIVATTTVFWRIDRAAGALMLPYIAWVSFAGVLNAALWQLNG